MLSQIRLFQEIGGYQFEGPYPRLGRIPQTSGLYAVITYNGKQYYLLDVGYDKNIRRACRINDSKECWEKNNQGKIHYAFFINDDFNEDYQKIAEEIRSKYKQIPCG